MVAIRDAEYNTNKLRPEAQNLKTLNAHTMDIMNKQIAQDNKRFCEKLMETKSFYPTTSIIEKTNHLEYISQNMSFNARRAKSVRNLQSATLRPKSSYSTLLSTNRKKSESNFRPISGVPDYERKYNHQS